MKAINANSIMKFVERFEELAAIKKKELNITLYLNAPMLRYAMEKFPVHEVEIVRHGRWIKEQLSGYEPHYICSECGKLHHQDYNFCNNCGAKMDLREDQD